LENEEGVLAPVELLYWTK